MSRAFAFKLAGVAAALCLLELGRWLLWTNGSDTGTFAQAILHTASGFSNTTEGGTHFRFHWSPILAVLWPLVAITQSPLSLQIAQVLLILASVFPLIAIVRSYAGQKWAERCGVLLLVYPPLLAATYEEFHELAFYPVLALALVWAADRARWVWFAIFGIALALVREDVSVEVAVIALALAVLALLRRRTAQRGLLLGEPREPRRLAIACFALAAVCVASLAFYAAVVLPSIGPWKPSHFYSYPFAQGPLQTVLAIFTHPLALAAAVFTFGRLTYVLEALAPLAFLPLRSRWSLLALPAFLGVLLSSDSSVWRMGNHYALLWTPWLLLGASMALVAIVERSGEIAASRWWWAVIAISAAILIAFNPMHPAHYLFPKNVIHSADTDRALACVPHNAPLMTHDEWFAHIALKYPHAQLLSEQAREFHGYVVYSWAWPNAAAPSASVKLLPRTDAEARRMGFTVVCHFGDVFALSRK